MDLGGDRTPAIERRRKLVFGGDGDRPIERHPRHHLRVGEVPPRPAHLPDALVRLPPEFLEKRDERPLELPGRRVWGNARLQRQVHRVHYLAVDIELELVDGGIPDPHGSGALVTGQPRQLEFGQPPFAGGTIHDLQVPRIAGHRPQQPVAPRQRLLGIAADEKRIEREGRVPQPAVAIVPVADAADLLRQRGGRGRDDAPRRCERQRLQGDQGTHDFVGPVAVIGATPAPLLPPRAGVFHRRADVDRRRRLVRGVPGQQERHAVPLAHGELGARGQIHAVGLDRGPERQRVWAADGAQRAVDLAHPRHDAAVVEADDQLHLHPHLAAHAFHHANEIGIAVARRHAVDQPHGAGRGGELGFEDEGKTAIAARGGDDTAGGRDQPAAVAGIAEEGGEAGRRIEARHAQPVDGTVRAHEGRGLRVTDQAVLFDSQSAASALPLCYLLAAAGRRPVRVAARAAGRTSSRPGAPAAELGGRRSTAPSGALRRRPPPCHRPGR